MDCNKFPQRHAQVAARVLGDQTIVVLADSGEVNVLNPVATRVWDLIDGTHSVEQIAEMIASEYVVERQEAFDDVTGFLQELLDVKAITLLSAPR